MDSNFKVGFITVAIFKTLDLSLFIHEFKYVMLIRPIPVSSHDLRLLLVDSNFDHLVKRNDQIHLLQVFFIPWELRIHGV